MFIKNVTFQFSIPYNMLRRGDRPFVRAHPQHRFCIKMHVTKYGYNEFGPMVPWASLYTKFTVLQYLFMLRYYKNSVWCAKGYKENKNKIIAYLQFRD